MIVIVGAALIAMGFSAMFVFALSRMAARADRDTDRLFAERGVAARAPAQHQSYAGFARAHATIAFESSMVVPSPRTRVGTQRLPVSSFTARRPGV